MHGFDQSDQNTWLDRGGNRRLIGSSSSSNLFLFQSSVYRVDCRRVGLDQIKSLERGGSIRLIGLGSNSCTSCKCQQSDVECLKDTCSSRHTHIWIVLQTLLQCNTPDHLFAMKKNMVVQWRIVVFKMFCNWARLLYKLFIEGAVVNAFGCFMQIFT